MKPLTQSEFIALFPHTRFRYIHDVKKLVVQGSDSLDSSWNEKGYGVFYTVNGFPSTGKADESRLLSLNANYVDFDVDASLSQEEKEKLIQETLMSGLESGAPTPTIVNRTQKGAHLIWLYPEPLEPTSENVAKWRQVQKRMVQCFKGDPAAKDPSRVLRVPYTLHLKNPANPFEIKIASYKPDARFTLEELDVSAPQYAELEADEKVPAKDLLTQGVEIGKGQRHTSMAQVAGLLLKDATTLEHVRNARLALYGWDRTVVKSPEPFQQRKSELDSTIDGIWKLELERRTKDEPQKDSPKTFRLWSLAEILGHDFGEEQWLVEPLITKQGITALSGNPGDYKTWTAIHIALCVARGGLVYGKFQATQGSVLIIDEEDHLRLIKGRLELLGANDTDSISYISQGGFKADDKDALAAVLEIVKEKDIKLVILDSLVRIHQQDENDAMGMAKVFSSIQQLIGAGASILFTHHHRKQQGLGNHNPGQSMRGSSDILAAVDSHLTIEKKRDDKDSLVITQTKSRQAEALTPFQIHLLKGPSGPSGFEYVGEYDEKKLKAAEVAASIVFLLADGQKSRPEIHEALNEDFGKSAIDSGLKIAEGEGTVVRVPKEELSPEERRKTHYRLPGVSSSPAVE